jgi:transposase
MIADRGYDSNEYRRALEGNNNEAVIPGLRNRKEEIEYDKEKYKKRGLIERIFGKIKENRRLTVRYTFWDLFLSPLLKSFFANSA